MTFQCFTNISAPGRNTSSIWESPTRMARSSISFNITVTPHLCSTVLIRPGPHVSIGEFIAVENERMIPLSESHQGVLHGGKGRARSFQFHVDGMNALCDVQLQGLQKQRPLVAERVIHALPPDFHDAHQVIGGCGGKALLRKKAYRLPKRFLLIKLLRSRHAPLLFRCSRSDYATYPPSMVRLAPVMKPASSDAR